MTSAGHHRQTAIATVIHPHCRPPAAPRRRRGALTAAGAAPAEQSTLYCMYKYIHGMRTPGGHWEAQSAAAPRGGDGGAGDDTTSTPPRGVSRGAASWRCLFWEGG